MGCARCGESIRQALWVAVAAAGLVVAARTLVVAVQGVVVRVQPVAVQGAAPQAVMAVEAVSTKVRS